MQARPFAEDEGEEGETPPKDTAARLDSVLGEAHPGMPRFDSVGDGGTIQACRSSTRLGLGEEGETLPRRATVRVDKVWGKGGKSPPGVPRFNSAKFGGRGGNPTQACCGSTQ